MTTTRSGRLLSYFAKHLREEVTAITPSHSKLTNNPTRKFWVRSDQHKFCKQTSLSNCLTGQDRNSRRNLESTGSPRPVSTTQASVSRTVTTTTIVSIFSRPKRAICQWVRIIGKPTTKTAITSSTQSASSRFPSIWALRWKMCLILQKYSRVRNTLYRCLMVPDSNDTATIPSSPTKWCSLTTSSTESLKFHPIRWWCNSSCLNYQGIRSRDKTSTSENRIFELA